MKSSNSFSKKEILTAVSMVLFRTVTGIVPALVLFDIKLPDELRNAVYSTAGTVVSAALILLYTVISAVMGKKIRRFCTRNGSITFFRIAASPACLVAGVVAVAGDNRRRRWIGRSSDSAVGGTDICIYTVQKMFCKNRSIKIVRQRDLPDFFSAVRMYNA